MPRKRRRQYEKPDGMVVSQGYQKQIKYLLGTILGLAVGLFSLIAGLIALTKDNGELAILGIGAGIIFLIGGVFCIVQLARAESFRLVIGTRGLELLDSRGEQIGYLPYENLAFARVRHVKADNDSGWRTDGVMLGVAKIKNRDTYWPKLRRREDYDILLRYFDMDPLALQQQIEFHQRLYYHNKMREAGR